MVASSTPRVGAGIQFQVNFKEIGSNTTLPPGATREIISKGC
jgi:hypothetical protein